MEPQLLIHVCNLLEQKLVSLAKKRLEGSRQDQEYRAFCALCAAEMIEIIESVKGSDHLHVKTAKLIKCLLRNLDRVCSYSSKKQKRPTKSAIAQQHQISHHTGSDQSRSSYPSLQALEAIQDASKMPKWISDGLESFAISDERGRLLDSLTKTSYRLRKHRPDEDYLEPEGNTDVGCDPPDNRHQMKALFRMVGKHRVCNCEPKFSGPMATYLGLNEKKVSVHVEEHVTPFKLFFTRHSPDIDTRDSAPRLRETVMRIKRKRMVNLSDELSEPSPANDLARIQDNFCNLISRASSLLCLHFFIYGDKLQLEGPKAQSKNWITDCHISLTEIFDIKGFSSSRKKRLHLSHLVAKAAWECYDSGWIESGLVRQNVHFLLEKSDCGRYEQLSTDEPFLKASFINHDTERIRINDTLSECLNLHKCPKILALGVLLLEIELGRGLDEYRHLILEEGQKPDSNTDYMAAVHVLDSMVEEWEERGTMSQHKAIIKACFNQQILRGCEDANSQRSILLKEIVGPLESLFRSQWEEKESQILPILYKDMPDSSGATKMPRLSVTQPFPLLPPPPPPPPPPLHSNSVPDPLEIGNTMVFSTTHSASAKWLERIDKEFCTLLRAKKAHRNSYKPVKIAVLDTGIHPQHYNITNIAGYRDFVNPSSQSHVDLTGHGSIGVSLIYRLLPFAQVYVARVFEKSQANKDTPALVAEAIRHAKNEWDADIITIASGFDNNQDCIRDEIISNTSNSPLIFSAASNDGNLGRIAFPASMSQCVMCMFASNGYAKPTQLSINPSAQESGGSNFAILGEDVEVQFCDALEPRRHSGTSIATFIGAAIAGVLLDFSKQPGCQEVVNPSLLKRIGGMSAVFKKMSVEDNGYNCIAPWSLLRGICVPTTPCTSEDLMDIRRKELGKNISNFLIDAGL